MNRTGVLIIGILILFLATACESSEPSYTAYVWEDADGDGRQGEDEEPLAGVVLQIIDLANGYLWNRPITDADGNTFPFRAGETCGQYAIYLSVPDGYWPTTPVVVNTPNCETARFGLKEFP